VTRPHISSIERSQLLGAAVLAGVTAFLACTVLSVPVAATLRLDALRSILPIIGCTLAIGTVNSVYLSLLRRDLRFSVVARVEMIKAVAQAVLSLVLASMGFAYWALVMSELGSMAIMWLLLHRQLRLVPQRPRHSVLGSWVVFGRDLVVSRVAWYLYTNADFAIVGRRFGSAALGDYSMAFTLVSLPVEKLATLLFSVAPSVLTKVRDDEIALKRYVLLLFELLGVLVLPLSVGLCLTIPELVLVVLGSKWERVIPLVQIMSVFAVAKSFAPLGAAVLLSTGNSAEPRRQALLGLAVMPLSFLIGSYWGVLGVAIAWTVVFPVLTFFQLGRALKALRIHAADVLRALAPALTATAVMAGAVLSLRHALFRWAVSDQATLTLLVMGGAVSFVLVFLILARDRTVTLWLALRRGGPA
jgi:O-antigen/teichoic acid export membrane protein